MPTFKIAIGAGHGYTTPGKETLQPIPVKEWTLNNRAALAMQAVLDGYEVEYLRVDDPTGSTDVPLPDRVAAAEAWGADLYISIHHNAHETPETGTGVEVYRSKSDATNFADQLVTRISEYTGLPSRGAKTEDYIHDLALDGYYVHRENSILAYLVEGGFMTTQADIDIITTPEGADAYGRAIAEVIVEYNQIKRSVGSGGSGTGFTTSFDDDAIPSTNILDAIAHIHTNLSDPSHLILHADIGSYPNLKTHMPTATGIFEYIKVSTELGIIKWIDEATSDKWSGRYLMTPNNFTGLQPQHVGLITDDMLSTAGDDIKTRVATLEAFIGDILKVQNYGNSLEEILNEMSDRVLFKDISDTANAIHIQDYLGDAAEIPFYRPITIEVNTDSVVGTGTIRFEGFNNSDVTYPLKVTSISAGIQALVDLDADSYAKKYYYTLIKILDGVTPTFTFIPTTTDVSSVSARVTALEGSVPGKAEDVLATASNKGLMTAADKAKLDTVASNANNYSHPATHSADEITTTTSKQFVTSLEKSLISTAVQPSTLNSYHTKTETGNEIAAAIDTKFDSGSSLPDPAGYQEDSLFLVTVS